MNRSKCTIAVLNIILYPIEIYRQKTYAYSVRSSVAPASGSG